MKLKYVIPFVAVGCIQLAGYGVADVAFWLFAAIVGLIVALLP